jgi:hypothetical protein
MKASGQQFVQSCNICQHAKPNCSKYQGLLAHLPIPTGAWQTIYIDFMEGLPQSGSSNCILVVVDKFYMYSHFLPLHHTSYPYITLLLLL